MKIILPLILTLSTLVACTTQLASKNNPEPAAQHKIGATLNDKQPLKLEDIPPQAMSSLLVIQPNFIALEAEKELKHGNVYLDIEGEANGSEIEFDMLQTQSGWQVVEVQRDLEFSQMPTSVQNVLNEQRPNLTPKRIIESVQYRQNITIFELYSVNQDGNEARTEVKLEQGEASLLTSEWKH